MSTRFRPGTFILLAPLAAFSVGCYDLTVKDYLDSGGQPTVWVAKRR